MGAITLELFLKPVEGMALDPQPDFSFDHLLEELRNIEQKLDVNSFTKLPSRELSASRANEKSSKGFVMHVRDDEIDTDSDSEEFHKQPIVAGRRFTCAEFYISDDSDDESALGIQNQLMDPVGLVEGALSDITHEHRLSITDEIRNQISALEADLINENEKFALTLERVGKYPEMKRDIDRKLDMQYQRRIAEALDNHLTAVQRDHEQRSQIEERKIRDDAAREEARRREKALQEEKARQEKLKAEAERQAKLEAERVKAEKAATEEAERRAAKKAAEENASVSSRNPAPAATVISESHITQPNASKSLQPAGAVIKGAESALKLEERRLQMYKKVAADNKALGFGSNKEYRKHEMQIVRRIRTITGTKESVRLKASELIGLLNDPSCPQSISISMFAEKFVSVCTNPTGSFSNAVYAYARVIANITSKYPLAMDILIAELNRVCIFTVPKYISYSEAAFENQESYKRAIGYQFEDGKLESTDSYLKRITAYMKLYGALVQTEGEGFQNLHGITEGWAWLARFLNALPANLYTATALQAFLEMAGFALFKRFKSQFIKLVNVIQHDFLKSLKGREDPNLSNVIANMQNYIESRVFQNEPEGRQLKTSLDSSNFSGLAHEEQHHYQSNRFYNSPGFY